MKEKTVVEKKRNSPPRGAGGAKKARRYTPDEKLKAVRLRLEEGFSVQDVCGEMGMAVIVGCAAFQWNQPPRTAPAVFKPHVAIELNSTNCGAFTGQYLFPPDYRFLTGAKLTIWREGDHLFGQGQTGVKLGDAFKLYPESETNFFLTPENERELTFIKNEKGSVTAAIVHDPGMPDSEGKKVSDSSK